MTKEDSEVIKKFRSILRYDADYKRAFKDNIAMAFKDEYAQYLRENTKRPSWNDIHIISNEAATNFIKNYAKKK